MFSLSLKKIIWWSVFLLCAIAMISFFWSLDRSFLGVMINANEGWNAFFADAAMGKMQLYPSPEQLITNNYPPLSFYVVGFVGKIIGNNILAGRLISLLAVGVIAFFIAKVVKKLGGSCQGSLVGGACFIATLALFFKWYVGANDPQLLAQAIMIGGFFLFLKALDNNRGYSIAIAVMVIAGFFKHNIITLPLTSLLWLVIQKRWRPFFFCSCLALLLILLGFGTCLSIYGFDFYYNFTNPRQCLLFKMSEAFFDLSNLLVAIIFWCATSWKFRKESSMQLVSMMVLIGLVVGFLQRLGNGVFVNAYFDLVIALAIAFGVAFTLLAREGSSGMRWQLAGVMALLFSFVMSSDFLNIFSPAYHARLAESERLMTERIESVSAMPGDVFCESYVAYRAGKPFAADALNVEERMRVGRLPKDTMSRRIEEHQLQEVDYVWDVGIE